MDQQRMRSEYERQQTHEGQVALRIKRELATEFSAVVNKPIKVGMIQPLINAVTGEVEKYFIAE